LGPLATATLVVAANLPDLDVIGSLDAFGGQPYYLCCHRGLTHSLLGIAAESLLLAGVMCALGAWASRRWGGERPRFRGVWLAATVGLLSHLCLDALNTYGVRPFLPFSPTWYYGDVAFIVDPWLWLFFGLAACLGAPRASPSPPPARAQVALAAAEEQAEAGEAAAAQESVGEALRAMTADPPLDVARERAWGWLGGLGWSLMTVGALSLLFLNSHAPRAVAWVWLAAWLCVLVARHFRLVRRRRRAAWIGITLALSYLAFLGILQRQADLLARARVLREDSSLAVASTTHPAPAIPWRFTSRVATAKRVYRLEIDLLRGTSVDPDSLLRALDHPDLKRVRDTREYAAWKVFARIPFVARQGETLILGDARYDPYVRPSWCNLAVRLR
jgi:hypothetical protein